MRILDSEVIFNEHGLYLKRDKFMADVLENTTSIPQASDEEAMAARTVFSQHVHPGACSGRNPRFCHFDPQLYTNTSTRRPLLM